MAALLWACASARAASQLAPRGELDTSVAIRELPSDLAARSIPVHIEGMVAFYNRNGGDLFVVDSTGGLYANYSGPASLTLGTRISLRGVTAQDFTNYVESASIAVLSAAPELTAKPVAMPLLASGKADCEFVDIKGLVRSASVFVENRRPMLQLLLESGGLSVDVRILDFSNFDFESLLGSEIRVTGSAGGYFNVRKELTGVFVSTQSVRQIRVLHKSLVGPYQLPVQPLGTTLRYRKGLYAGQRAHLQGTVTYIDPGISIAVQSGVNSLLIRSRQITALDVGSRIDAVGFLAYGHYSPFLDDANFRTGGIGEKIVPLNLPWPSALNAHLDSTLVSIDADLLSASRDASQYSFALSSGKTLFSALLGGPKDAALGRIEPGSRLRVTGICSVETDSSSKSIRGYRLLLRSPRDLVILSAPRFWSERRLLFLVGGLVAFVLLSTSWVILLRRRVEDQSQKMRRVLDRDAASVKESAFRQQSRNRVLEQISRRDPLTSVFHSIKLLLDEASDGDDGAGASSCIHLKNQDGSLDIVLGSSLPLQLVERLGHVLVDSSELCALAVLSGRPVQTETPEAAHSLPILLADGEAAGAITVFQKSGVFTPALLERLELAVQLSVLAIDNRRLYDNLIYRSQHDSLTGLPNRARLDEELTLAMTAASASAARFAIAYVDLDKFKQVNDVYGHYIGDCYLQNVAVRLRDTLRDCDTLARVGGDEFIALIPEIRDCDHATQIVARLNDSLRAPLAAGDGRELTCSASIGLALFPDNGRTLDELKHFADKSMYRAKRASEFVPSNIRSTPNVGLSKNTARSSEAMFADDLRLAINRQQLVVHYQPIFCRAGSLTGFEALVRIESPTGELISPAAFIETAEKSGLIVEIGSFVLREATHQAAVWNSKTRANLIMALNVSACQLASPAFSDGMFDALALSGLPPELLRLELTESMVVENIPSAVMHLEKLRRSGVSIAIDDFGTGYANLAALQKLAFDIIKIDRSFVVALDEGNDSTSSLHLLKAIMSIAKSMNAKTVAEGIEFPYQASLLERLGCSEMQGFGLARPMSAKSIETHFEQLLTPVSLAARLDQNTYLTAPSPIKTREPGVVLELTGMIN